MIDINDNFGFIKTNNDAHTLGLTNIGNLIKDCGLRVYYFDNKEKQGSENKRMHVSKEGELITQWPEGFFSNEIDEVFDI